VSTFFPIHRRLLILLLGFFLCCGPGEDPQQDLRQHYLAALQAPSVEAIAHCNQLPQDTLRGNCLTYVAADLATAHQTTRAFEVCESITSRLWQQECWFLVTDNAQLIGHEGAQACARSGRYHHRCLGHLATRTVAQAPGLSREIGQEDALWKEAHALVQTVASSVPPSRIRTFTRTAVAETLMRRWSDQPMALKLCGVAAKDVCEQAIQDTAQADSMKVSLEKACANSPTSASIHALGGTPWVPSIDPMARRAWRGVCARLHSTGAPIPPPPGTSRTPLPHAP